MNHVGIAVRLSESGHPAPLGHPENCDRFRPAVKTLEQDPFSTYVTELPPVDYGLDPLARVHTDDYLRMLRAYTDDELNHIDPDTYRYGGSFGASCDVTNAVLSGVEQAFSSDLTRSVVIGRPPGHHAGSSHTLGFCLVNHVAAATQFALDHYSCEQAAIVDFDVHHGNGTQEIFYSRNDVLYISTHQYPFYPGTGSRSEQGEGQGEGYTINYPLPAGTDDAALVQLFENEIVGELVRFDPDIILVSAGFDGHRLDPLGGFMLTGEGFGRLAEILKGVADEVCQGRLVSLVEGGYDRQGNIDSITNYIKGLT